MVPSLAASVCMSLVTQEPPLGCATMLSIHSEPSMGGRNGCRARPEPRMKALQGHIKITNQVQAEMSVGHQRVPGRMRI